MGCPYFLYQVGRWFSPRFIINLCFLCSAAHFWKSILRILQDTSKGRYKPCTSVQHRNEKALTAKQTESQWLERTVSWVRKLGGPGAFPVAQCSEGCRKVHSLVTLTPPGRLTMFPRHCEGLVGGSFK